MVLRPGNNYFALLVAMVFARADFPRAMSTLEESDWPGFGLSLPRMFLWLRGKEPRRAERSALEAYAIGTFMYLLCYLSAAQFILPRIDSAALRLPGLILLVVMIWLFWLLVLYVNSILILLFRRIGLHKGSDCAHLYRSVLSNERAYRSRRPVLIPYPAALPDVSPQFAMVGARHHVLRNFAAPSLDHGR